MLCYRVSKEQQKLVSSEQEHKQMQRQTETDAWDAF